LPIEQPTRLELVIDMKTATAAGFSISPSLRLRADQIIEDPLERMYNLPSREVAR
jgi:putative ABC transport system substrate-binding protein